MGWLKPLEKRVFFVCELHSQTKNALFKAILIAKSDTINNTSLKPGKSQLKNACYDYEIHIFPFDALSSYLG
jgi:hypothetical protein